MDIILKPEHIQKYYGNEGGLTKSIKDISFSEEAGEFLGIFHKENLCFVFQNFNLLDTLIISENIVSTLSINKIEPRITEMAKSLNISDILNKYHYQVSGDQKQRCACVRVIINKPKLILRDGEIFIELRKGNDSRTMLFEKILSVLTMMGGGKNDVY